MAMSEYVKLEERIRGMAASTAILTEAAKGERQRLGDSLEDRRQEIQDLRLELVKLKQEQASQAQVRVALISGMASIVGAAIALAQAFLGG